MTGGDEGGGGTRRANAGGSRRGGFETSRYNYGILSNPCSHFFLNVSGQWSSDSFSY